MAITYEPIATTTVSGTSTNSVIFSSIPGTYTDIVFICEIDADSDVSTRIRLNNDSGSNYSQRDLRADGSSVSSSQSSNLGFLSLGAGTATNTTLVTGSINSYSNSTTNKVIVSRANNPINTVLMRTMLWRDTSAITAIEFYVSSGNWFAGSTFTLYGIKAA